MSARFDNKRGLGAGYGVPALAGKVLSFEGGSKHLEIHDETTSGRLKPGLHALCSSCASERSRLAAVEDHLAFGKEARAWRHWWWFARPLHQASADGIQGRVTGCAG